MLQRDMGLAIERREAVLHSFMNQMRRPDCERAARRGLTLVAIDKAGTIITGPTGVPSTRRPRCDGFPDWPTCR